MPNSTIMIIDESPEELHLFEEILSGEGYATVTAASCTEVLSNPDSKNPDMILLDEDTDNHDGHKIKQLAARFCNHIPIVLITHNHSAANQHLHDDCVSGIIPMPSDRSNITTLIHDLIRDDEEPIPSYMYMNPKF